MYSFRRRRRVDSEVGQAECRYEREFRRVRGSRKGDGRRARGIGDISEVGEFPTKRVDSNGRKVGERKF